MPYLFLARIVNAAHRLIVMINIISLVFIVSYAPWYFWLPILTVMLSPLVEGTYCFINVLEDKLLEKAEHNDEDQS